MPDRLAAPRVRLAGNVKPIDPLYRSKAWQELASACKAASGYTCDGCKADHSATKWKLRADHIVAVKDGGAPLDPRNVRVLCAVCDNRNRMVEHQRRGEGRS